MGNLQMTTLQEQVDLLSEILAQEVKLSITGAELSTVFGRNGSWAHGMIAQHLHQLDSPDHLHPRGPRLVDVPLDDDVIRFCLRRQPVMFAHMTDYLAEKLVFVERFGVCHFVHRQSEKIAVQRAKLLEKERHEVSVEDLKTYFANITAHLTSVPPD
jgi:hypothetical protein